MDKHTVKNAPAPLKDTAGAKPANEIKAGHADGKPLSAAEAGKPAPKK